MKNNLNYKTVWNYIKAVWKYIKEAIIFITFILTFLTFYFLVIDRLPLSEFYLEDGQNSPPFEGLAVMAYRSDRIEDDEDIINCIKLNYYYTYEFLNDSSKSLFLKKFYVISSLDDEILYEEDDIDLELKSNDSISNTLCLDVTNYDLKKPLYMVYVDASKNEHKSDEINLMELIEKNDYTYFNEKKTRFCPGYFSNSYNKSVYCTIDLEGVSKGHSNLILKIIDQTDSIRIIGDEK